MEPKCNNCANVQALIYCKSDSAKLCRKCDVHVHSANPISLRHTRYLLCQKCFSQPAVICCLNEKVSYCQGCCQWHATNCSVIGHILQSVNPFTGCPFSTEWPSILEPSVSGLVNPFVGSLPLDNSNNAMFGMVKTNELNGLVDEWPHTISYTQNLSDQSPFFSVELKGCPDLVKLEEDEEELNLDNAPLNFDVGDDIIGWSSQEEIELDHAVPNCLLIDKNNTSFTASNFTTENSLETSSPGQQDGTSYQSGPLQMNINTTGLPLPPSPVLFGQIHPTMPLTISNITGESNAAEYQNCGMSPGFIMNEAAWESNLEVSYKQARNQARLRLKEKKLKYGKQIRYASRKARADARKRVKGRFVKAGDTYDYDPSSPPPYSQ